MSDHLKLLYHHRTQGTGAEGTHIRGVLGAFRALGHEVNILSPPGVQIEGLEGGTSHSGDTHRQVWNLLSRSMPEPLFEGMELAYNLTAMVTIRGALAKYTPDLLYERYALFGFAGAVIAKRSKLPFLLEVNDSTVITRSRRLHFRTLAERLEAFVFKNATILLPVSRRFAELIQAKHGHLSDAILVMPNAVDPGPFMADALPPAAIGSQPFTMGMVAAFVAWHGGAFLIRAVADFLRRTGSKLILIGDGPERPTLEALVHSEALQQFVTMTGSLPASRVPAYLREFDVCIMADSNEHGSPMKIFEYMASGKPVIAPRYGPIEDIISHGVDGWIFEPKSGESLRQAVQVLYDNPELRRTIGLRARDAVLSAHTWTHRVNELLTKIHTSTTLSPRGRSTLPS